MKKLTFILLIIFSSSILFGQRIRSEAGISVGVEAITINYAFNTYNDNNFIAGIGMNFIQMISYNGISKPKGLPFNISDSKILGVEVRGPWGIGAGLRVLTNTGLGIECGYLATWESRYRTYDWKGIPLNETLYWNKYKGYLYARMLIYDNESKFTVGFELNKINTAGLYLGFKF